MEKIIKNILVPINFSNSSDKALQIAIAMCKRHNASLHLLKTNKVNNFPYPSGKSALLIGIRLESKVAELKSIETNSIQIEENHQIKCFYHLVDGDFSKTVAETADDFHCDLIILEKKFKPARFNLQSNKEFCKIIKNSPCAVMTVSANCQHENFKSILFPVWVNRSIITKLQAASPIIKKNESKIVLLGSVKSQNDKKEVNMIGKLMCSVRSLISLTTKNIENEIEYAPSTAQSILRKAIEHKSDLIVLSANENSGFRSLFEESYNRFIIDHSIVPVLSLK